MALKLVSLNVERGEHLPRVLSFLAAERPDVTCLYEVRAVDLPRFSQLLGEAYFVPMCTVSPERLPGGAGVQGIAVFSPGPCEHVYYQGTGDAPDFVGPNSEDRALVVTRVDGQCVIGATHFTWTPDGRADAAQRAALPRLLALLERFGVDLVCGDLNAPRGGEIFGALNERFVDNIPAEVTTTLDQELHRKKGLQLVVDVLFTRPPWRADVRVVSGVSDHCAIVALMRGTGFEPA